MSKAVLQSTCDDRCVQSGLGRAAVPDNFAEYKCILSKAGGDAAHVWLGAKINSRGLVNPLTDRLVQSFAKKLGSKTGRFAGVVPHNVHWSSHASNCIYLNDGYYVATKCSRLAAEKCACDGLQGLFLPCVGPVWLFCRFHSTSLCFCCLFQTGGIEKLHQRSFWVAAVLMVGR